MCHYCAVAWVSNPRMAIAVDPVDGDNMDGVGTNRVSMVDGGCGYHRHISPLPPTTTVNRSMYIMYDTIDLHSYKIHSN